MRAPSPAPLVWTHRLAALGPEFFTRLPATPVPEPHWIARNPDLLAELDWPPALLGEDWLPVWAGNANAPGSDPLATVYSGHQFGVWAGQLGDGRALLLGEADARPGPMEIQLKGAGRTPYSRMGDGRAVLRSSIREYLASEALHGLGIPTTRALCLVGSPLPVVRETVETAAIVTRVAPSFLRFGHLQHFAARDQVGPLRALADFAIEHHLPQARERAPAWQGQVYAGLLDEVVQRTAKLLAQWQAVGFCHGVMNTDNMSLLGLTIDYGPFQFLDAYDPGHICNHSDHQGRYAFDQQPQVAHWNLYALGQALLPLIGDHDLTVAVLEAYPPAFTASLQTALRAKLGLPEGDVQAADAPLVNDVLALLAAQAVDHTMFWRRLSQAVRQGWPGTEAALPPAWTALGDLFIDQPRWAEWRWRYVQRLQHLPPAAVGHAMLRTNPKYVLRNHMAELAIRQAQGGDFAEVERLRRLLRSPYDEHPDQEHHAGFPPDWAQSLSISCSS